MKEAVPLGWRGGWSPEMTYQPGEVVTDEGSSYVAQAENVDVRPRECVGEDACAWSLLAIQGLRGPQGALGPAGAQGPGGLQGPAGTPGAVKGYHVVSSQGAMGNWDSQVHSVKCPAGKVPVGGGGMTTSDPASGAQPGEKYLAVSRPWPGSPEWYVRFRREPGPFTRGWAVVVYAVCVDES